MDKKVAEKEASGKPSRTWDTNGRPVIGREPVVKNMSGKIIRDDRDEKDKR